uniref:glycerophosphodiester phosphodiesterase n=1 Tax=Wollemia nobilis TaxID=56998 RepID=A0A0C9SB61_9CONI
MPRQDTGSILPGLSAQVLVLVLLLFVSEASCDRKRNLSFDRGERVLAGVSSRRVWKTLSGQNPLVIARGGLSGLFPDHTSYAYQVALNNSLPDVVFYCDLQLTKDSVGICRTEINLDNSTNIADVFKDRKNTYIVNGQKVTGWFSIDFTAEEILSKVFAKQSSLSRPYSFGELPVLPVEGVDSLGPPALWLNVQYSKFYEEHNLSAVEYVLSTAKTVILDYVSSPEVAFLTKVRLGLRKSKSKLILRFLAKEDVEPSTNLTYGTLLKNLTLVKTFASGVLVPKDYIWPLDDTLYLHAPSTLVQDAHKAGLEVYASDFANDGYGMSYNYSYDPVREYLQFVDNSDFAVDGVLTDFSVTASVAIACYAHNRQNLSSSSGKPLIISHHGASGDFAGSTDIAYQAAIHDGVDYIDCTVQLTKDGVPICRESPDLIASTNVLEVSSIYPSRLVEISDLQTDKGIFTFDLTWKEIQSLKPQINSPYGTNYNLNRNPAYKNEGKFMTLFDFLKMAKGQASVGVLIDIQNARYLASKQGFDVINVTMAALEKAGYGNMTGKVMIQADDSAVLRKFRQTGYKLVYQILETTASLPDSTIKEIKGVADTVTLGRAVIFPTSDFFLMNTTNLVNRIHLHNLTVFIFRLRNEYPTLAFDYMSDPTMEINTFVNVAKPDGLFTEFPATTNAYFNNACRRPTRRAKYSMFLVEPGALLGAIPPSAMPPTVNAPAITDVIDPPLPSVHVEIPAPAPIVSAPSAVSKNGQPKIACHFMLYPVFSFFLLALLSSS